MRRMQSKKLQARSCLRWPVISGGNAPIFDPPGSGSAGGAGSSSFQVRWQRVVSVVIARNFGFPKAEGSPERDFLRGRPASVFGELVGWPNAWRGLSFPRRNVSSAPTLASIGARREVPVTERFLGPKHLFDPSSPNRSSCPPYLHGVG